MNKIRKPVTLDPDVVEYVDRRRAKEDRSFSAMVNHLLTQLALKDKLKKKV